ncbi:hypothetical protein SKAU_G00406420 [Synaphobranchus kaupii]|uniref:Circadian associated repressor of transcription n=1 Tax=Synaphobranchus kaupii TaxID=118154 RepID=A0A9Q1EA39_SYNKA|nr:hypothetical protein SKAU_G00406420 [Synaphobranchus kaupii]
MHHPFVGYLLLLLLHYYHLAPEVMQSFGSTSSWPSHDSLSSSHSFLFSESDQTEDEADVFLSEGEGDGGASVELRRPRMASPKARLAPGVFGDLAGPQLKRDQAGRCPGAPRVILVSPSGAVKTGGEGQMEGDFVFAQKCAELQGFVRPLLDLLNGLKRGKYDRGLSSFQQSVAMDRIQRIVGVLQNPGMGEKHLHTLLQVEMMLKLWFPQVSPSAPPTSATPPVLAGNVARGAAPRWRRDQLRIPVKKRRLSWRDVDSPTEPAPALKRFQQERPEDKVASAPLEADPMRLTERGRCCQTEEGKGTQGKSLSWPESRLASPPRPSKEDNNVPPPVTTNGNPATQDTYISSTTPLSPPPSLGPLRSKPMRCQSEPVATETEEGGLGWVSEASQRRSQSLPHLTKPFNAPEQ